MARKAREKRPGAVYHVLMRGGEKKALLQTENDCAYFVSQVRKYREDSDLELFGFCLLPDHVHLLVRENSDDMGTFFRKLATSYACHYNLKRKRAGHVFQDRYRTQILDGDEAFVSALRAIHTEPVRLGLCERAEDYPWSSLGDYLGTAEDVLTDTVYALSLSTAETLASGQGRVEFDFLAEPVYERKPLTDRQAEKIMKKVAHAKKLMALPVMSRKMRNAWLRRLRKEGMSVSQISRFTGLGRNIVSRACSDKAVKGGAEE